MTARRIVPLLLASLSLASGCGPTAGNRSPTPDLDPARYARAQQQTEDVIRENREAEARFFRRLGRVPGMTLPSEPTDIEIAHTRIEEGNP